MLRDVDLPLRATPQDMAALLCDTLASGAPAVYASNDDPDLRVALCGAVKRAGAARGLDVGAFNLAGRVLVYLRPGSRKEAPRA